MAPSLKSIDDVHVFVSDPAQAHLRAALGRDPDVVDHGVSWSLYFEDPDGNPYEITSYDHAAVSATIRAHPTGA